jgi:hypothetical protein
MSIFERVFGRATEVVSQEIETIPAEKPVSEAEAPVDALAALIELAKRASVRLRAMRRAQRER